MNLPETFAVIAAGAGFIYLLWALLRAEEF
jgi:hypothetical protein